MEVICDYCGETYKYKYGKVKYNKSKKHYCSRSCQNTTHGLSKRKNRINKNDDDTKYNMWLHAKKRCNKSGKEFNIEPLDIPNIPKI